MRNLFSVLPGSSSGIEAILTAAVQELESSGGLVLDSILDAVRALFSDGSLTLVKAIEGVFDKLTTADLEVQNQATFHQQATFQQWITIIDQGDGQPYCFTMLHGSPTTIPGACAASPTPTPPVQNRIFRHMKIARYREITK